MYHCCFCAENRQVLGELDGIDVLLQQLSVRETFYLKYFNKSSVLFIYLQW